MDLPAPYAASRPLELVELDAFDRLARGEAVRQVVVLP
jgi:hypothetical protein